MSKKDKQYTIYIRSTKESIPVNKEEFDAYYHDINIYRIRQQRHGRCVCPASKRLTCDMDCLTCPFHRMGDTRSLDYTETDDEGNETAWVDEIPDDMSGIYMNWNTGVYREYLKKFDLPENKAIKGFSKGMKVKLAFAVALSHKAELLILDEATSGLDPVIRDDILDILLDFVQDENHAVLVSSHIISDLEKIADYITFIHNGKLVFSYPKDDLIDNYGIVSCGAVVFDSLDKTDLIAYRKEDYQYKVLVKNRKKAERNYPKAIVEPATIEEIMLFHVKGELQ